MSGQKQEKLYFLLERGSTTINTNDKKSDTDYMAFVSEKYKMPWDNTLKFTPRIFKSMMLGQWRRDNLIWFLRDINIGIVHEDDGTLKKIRSVLNKNVTINLLAAGLIYAVNKKPLENCSPKRIDHHLQIMFFIKNSLESGSIDYTLSSFQQDYIKDIKRKKRISLEDEAYIKNLYGTIRRIIPDYSENFFVSLIVEFGNNCKEILDYIETI